MHFNTSNDCVNGNERPFSRDFFDVRTRTVVIVTFLRRNNGNYLVTRKHYRCFMLESELFTFKYQIE